MDGLDVAPAIAAIPTINGLLTKLIELGKDRKTSALVSQVHSLFQTVQSGYFDAQRKTLEVATQNYELTRKVGQLEDAQAKTIEALNASHAAKMAALHQSQATETVRLVAGHQQAVADLTAKQQQAVSCLEQRIADLTPRPTIRRTAGGPATAPTIPHRRVLPASGSKGTRQ